MPTPDSPPGSPPVVPYSSDIEAGIVRVLNAAFPNGWGSEQLWRWKHRDRPGFVPIDVLAAREGGEVVGCFHSGIFPLVIDPGLAVPMSFDGDFAIERAFRGRGIAPAIRDAGEPRLFGERVALRGGFTSPALNERLYEPIFDFIFVPAVTTEYRKVLGIGPLRPRVAQLGTALLARARVRRALARRPLTIDLHVEGLDSAHLVLAAEGFQLEAGAAAGGADLAVLAPYAVIASLADGAAALVRTAAAELARGRLRVRGVVRSGPRLGALLLSLLRSSG